MEESEANHLAAPRQLWPSDSDLLSSHFTEQGVKQKAQAFFWKLDESQVLGKTLTNTPCVTSQPGHVSGPISQARLSLSCVGLTVFPKNDQDLGALSGGHSASS